MGTSTCIHIKCNAHTPAKEKMPPWNHNDTHWTGCASGESNQSHLSLGLPLNFSQMVTLLLLGYLQNAVVGGSAWSAFHHHPVLFQNYGNE